jgi:glucose/mannose-6-phosphate isomerase
LSFLDDSSKVGSIDRSNMLNYIESTPEILMTTFNTACESRIEAPNVDISNSITFVGVGGSAICGDLISNWLSQNYYNKVFVNRNYKLAKCFTKDDFVIAISYSGNTFETLKQMKESLTRNIPIYAITSGGKMEQVCLQKSIPYIKLDAGIPPRAALPAIFGSISYLLSEARFTDASKINQVTQKLEKVREKIRYSVPTTDNPIKQLAHKIINTSVSVYALHRLESVARRGKCQLNENAKIPATFNSIPELCHNEIESLLELKKVNKQTFILIRDSLENRIESTILNSLKKLLDELVIKSSYEICSEGSTVLETMWASIYQFDYLSYYLALLRRIDPTPIPVITRFKSIFNNAYFNV